MRFSWRSQSPSQRLGLLRIIFFSFFLYKVNFDYLLSFSDLDLVVQCTRVMGSWLPVEFSIDQMLLIKWACVLFSIFSCVGFLTRFSMGMAFLSFLIINMSALKYCYWNHLYVPLHIPMAFWFLLDSESGYRMDSWLFKKASSGKKEASSIPFFINVQRIFFCIVFFATGFSKIQFGGLDWIFSSSLQNILFLQNYTRANFWVPELFVAANHWLIRQPALCQVLALAIVVLELITPMALLTRKLARILVSHLILMLISFYVFMYVDFMVWLILFVFWLPVVDRPTPMTGGGDKTTS